MSLFISRTFRQRDRAAAPLALPAGKVPVPSAAEARELDAALAGLAGDGTDGSPGTPGELAALSLLDDLYQRILDDHLQNRDATLMSRLLAVLRSRVGLDLLDRLLLGFAEEYLGARISGLSLWAEGPVPGVGEDLDRKGILRQMLVFWLLQTNPAARPIVRHTHAAPLLEIPALREIVEVMAEVLDREPGFGTEEGSLWGLLRRPQEVSPDSLSGQLVRLREIWPESVGDLVDRLDVFLGVLAEEQAPRFGPGPGPPQEVPSFEDLGEEVRFSSDQNWMPSLVLVAKHTLVWLHQLSEVHERAIERLDQIPEEELGRLAELGFNGLWLIGLWERSPASSRIKQKCGNPEAASSAYSLMRYRVAEELGGEEALGRLREGAARHGMRLAADMVPNHTGLDSDWMVDRAEWFIRQSSSPFPAYSFHGENLSSRPEIGVYLEDHYFDRSDAAVVFKRVDHRTGETTFVYHGNDGTSTPWNDTAQLDYLNPEVWPAVIDTIVEVAKRFPIIRFDAAMTLTRKHFQRLWYPAPGTAGDIPSRAEHGMTTEAFRRAMPQEFWRQVVDRVAQEAPNTLLLAEAFWLMEGFFVRTLGMHRVYNSAFMNMLRDGETGNFRRLIEETLLFDPGILQRYVNFMSNPDELSAIEQFGDGDRYFGTCVVMATLPGLPMFGHGQVEGWREQYGMEYRRSYHQEPVRRDLEQRHLQQIAPLLHRRDQFAGVEDFRLFAMNTDGGDLQSDVLAYSNGSGDRSSLVLFNNSDHPVRGRLKTSAPGRVVNPAGSDEPETVEIGWALDLAGAEFWSARDRLTDSEFLFDSEAVLQGGLELELAPWESRVLVDFAPAGMTAEWARRVHDHLGCRGATSLAAVRTDLALEPFRRTLLEALDPALTERLMSPFEPLEAEVEGEPEPPPGLRRPVEHLCQRWGLEGSEADRRVAALETMLGESGRSMPSKDRLAETVGEGYRRALVRQPETLPTVFSWVLLTLLLDAVRREMPGESQLDWRLEESLGPLLQSSGGHPDANVRCLAVLEQAMRLGWGRQAELPPAPQTLQHQILNDEDLRLILGVNQFEGREYLSREALETLLDLRLWLECLAWEASGEDEVQVQKAISQWSRALEQFALDAEASRYQTDQLGVVVVDPISDPES